MTSLDHKGPGLSVAIKWSYAANISTATIRMFLLMFLARVLEPEDFGTYGTFLAVLGFAGLLLGLGLNQAVIQRPNLKPEHVTLALAIVGVGGTIGGLIIAVVAAPLGRLFDTPEISTVLAFGSPILVLNLLSTIGFGLARRFMDFRWLTLVGLITLIGVFTPIAVILALNDAGVWSLVIAMGAQSVASLLAMVLRWRNLDLKAPARLRDSADLLKYGSKTAIYNGLFSAENLFLTFTILNTLGLTELGVYNRANRLRELAQEQLGMSAVGAIFSHFARVHGRSGDLSREFRGTLALVSSVMIPLFFGASTSSDIIVKVVLGEKFISAANLLTWLFPTVPMIINQAIASNVVVATGRVWPSIRAQLICLGVFASAIVLMPKVNLESLVLLWVSLVFLRLLIFNAIAMQATGLSFRSFLALHYLGVWAAGFVCVALLVSKYLFLFLSPILLLPLLIVVGALALGLSFLIAPAALYEPYLVQTAFRFTQKERLSPLRRLLILKFGSDARA